MAASGISNDYRFALVDILEDFIATRGLDWESRRRAQYLKMHLEDKGPDDVARRFCDMTAGDLVGRRVPQSARA